MHPQLRGLDRAHLAASHVYVHVVLLSQKKRKKQKEDREKRELSGGIGNLSEDVSRLSEDIFGLANITAKQVSDIRQDAADVRMDIQKVLDSQALFVAVCKQGAWRSPEN